MQQPTYGCQVVLVYTVKSNIKVFIVVFYGGTYIDWEQQFHDHPVPRVRHWKHCCFALDIDNQKAQAYEGGFLRLNGIKSWDVTEKVLENKPSSLNGMLLGTELSEKGRQKFTTYTSVNIFTRFLSSEEMANITGCREDMEGDYLSWNSSKWILSGGAAVSKTISSDTVCQPRNGTTLLFLTRVTGMVADETCKKLKGTLWAPQNEEEHAVMYNLHNGHKKLKEGICTGYHSLWVGHRGKISHEGNPYIYNIRTGETMYPEGGYETYPFALNQKPALYNLKMSDLFKEGNYETCMIADMVDDVKSQLWPQYACQWHGGYKCCATCFFPGTDPTGIQVRGLCVESVFYESAGRKRYMTLEQDQDGNLTYKGLTSSLIVYNEQAKVWNWILKHKPESYAISKSLFGTFLLGKHSWTFFGDTCFEDGSEHTISFSVCYAGSKTGKGSEFACDNGMCILTDLRCDGIANCRDSSDEKNCNKVKIGEEYSKTNVPYVVEDDSIIKNKVNVSVSLTQILTISEIDSVFALKFVLSLDWIDNRLSYVSLNPNSDLNSLNEEEKERIWVPQLIFLNTRDNKETLNDGKTMIQIERQGDLTVAKENDLDNEFSFEGSQNRLMLQRMYAIDFDCDYYMAWYPFDLQKCTIVMGLRSKDVNYMEIIPKLLEYTGPKDLSQYYVKEFRMKKVLMRYMKKKQNTIVVEVILGRRLLSTILTVYVPTILLNVIGHSTNFF